MPIREEIEIRHADFAQDSGFAYHYLYKPSVEPLVLELTGGIWEETARRGRFDAEFHDPGMMMIAHHGQDVGCYCLSHQPDKLFLEMFYLLPDYQRQGIGGKIVASAVQVAKAIGKPLELAVFANNARSYQAFLKNGFEPTESVIDGWRRLIMMTHRDTIEGRSSAPQTALSLQNSKAAASGFPGDAKGPD